MITIEYYRIFMAWICFLGDFLRFGIPLDASPSFTTDLGGRPASFFQVKTCLLRVYDQIPLAIHVFFTVCNRNGILHDATRMYINPSINPTPRIISSQRKLQDIQRGSTKLLPFFVLQESGWTTDQQGGYWFATISPGERDLDQMFLLIMFFLLKRWSLSFLSIYHLTSNMLPPSSKTMGHFLLCTG